MLIRSGKKNKLRTEHLNLHKESKQKDRVNYILWKGKINYGKIVTLGSYSVCLRQLVVNERLQLSRENFGVRIGVTTLSYGRYGHLTISGHT